MLKTGIPDSPKVVTDTPHWAYDRCPSCGIKYRYVENNLYRPSTCNNYDCLKRYLHRPGNSHYIPLAAARNPSLSIDNH